MGEGRKRREISSVDSRVVPKTWSEDTETGRRLEEGEWSTLISIAEEHQGASGRMTTFQKPKPPVAMIGSGRARSCYN